MIKLIEIIDEVTKYGLKPNLKVDNKEVDLEKNLIHIYLEYFQIQYKFDNSDYPEFRRQDLPDIIKNVGSNFPDFGYYHSIFNCHEIYKDVDTAGGHAIDDLSDIVYDLLEIKWRIQNNSLQDGLWFFELIFRSHTQQHILGMLNFMKSKNG